MHHFPPLHNYALIFDHHINYQYHTMKLVAVMSQHVKNLMMYENLWMTQISHLLVCSYFSLELNTCKSPQYFFLYPRLYTMHLIDMTDVNEAKNWKPATRVKALHLIEKDSIDILWIN